MGVAANGLLGGVCCATENGLPLLLESLVPKGSKMLGLLFMVMAGVVWVKPLCILCEKDFTTNGDQGKKIVSFLP